MLNDYDDKYTEKARERIVETTTREDGSLGYMEIVFIGSAYLILGLALSSFLAATLILLGIACLLHAIRLILRYQKTRK